MDATEPRTPQGVSRRDVLRLGAVGAGSLALGLGTAACSTSSSKGSGAAGGPAFTPGPAQGTPVRGGTLTVGMITSGKAETINVPATINNPDIARIFNLYDPMFTLAPDGKVGPGLIEEATPNSNATVWNLHIRPGVQFHDGKSLTADDVVYTIQHLWGDKANLYYAALKPLIDFGGVRKVGPLDVRVPLLRGIALFPTITVFNSLVIVQDGTKDFSNGLGTGPFKLVSFNAGQSSAFVANKNYWRQGQPYVDQLVINSSFSNESTRMNALLAGQVDIIPTASPTLVRANASSGRVVVGNEPGPGFVPIIMRVDKGPLADVRIRQAMKLIPERQFYVDTIFDGYATVGNDLAGYTDQYYATDLKATHDPGKARSLLKAAGAEGLKLTLDTADAAYGMNETAALFAQQAKQVGVTVSVNQTDPTTYFSSAAGFYIRPLATSFYNTGVNSLPVFYLLACTPGGAYNETHWGSPSDDALLYDALGETNPSKAATKWHAVQQRQFEAGGYIILENQNWIDAYSSKVRGINTTSAMNCNNFDFASAWLAK